MRDNTIEPNYTHHSFRSGGQMIKLKVIKEDGTQKEVQISTLSNHLVNGLEEKVNSAKKIEKQDLVNIVYDSILDFVEKT